MRRLGLTLIELMLLFSIIIVLSLIVLLFYGSSARADEGREPGDPRIRTHMGSFSGTYTGPWTGANRWFPHGSGITIGTPEDQPLVDWKALHLARVAEVAETKLENIEFEFDKADIEEQYFDDLNEVALLLRQNPEVRLTLSGHTDLMGTPEYNDLLADRRANAVRDALIGRGVPSESLTTIGFGESNPLEAIEAPLRKNRRVEVTVSVEQPTYLD